MRLAEDGMMIVLAALFCMVAVVSIIVDAKIRR